MSSTAAVLRGSDQSYGAARRQSSSAPVLLHRQQIPYVDLGALSSEPLWSASRGPRFPTRRWCGWSLPRSRRWVVVVRPRPCSQPAITAGATKSNDEPVVIPVSYTHLRAHET